MDANEVIDLVSTDDEALPPEPFSSTVVPHADTRSNDDFLFLSDPVENEWAVSSPKRQKLAPDEKENALPSLARINRKDESSWSRPGHQDKREDYGWENIDDESSWPRAGQQDKSRNYDWRNIDDEDPIVFTSSAHLPAAASRTTKPGLDQTPITCSDSDDSLPNDILTAPLRNNKLPTLSEWTTALLASLAEPRSKPARNRKKGADEADKKQRSVSRQSNQDRDSSVELSASEKQATGPRMIKRKKITEAERASQVAQKEKEKEERTKEKERIRGVTRDKRAKEKQEEKERKTLQREEKAKEKQIAADLAEVNKSKLDKKDSTSEMIVDLPASIDGQTVNTQTKEFLKNLDVDTTLYQSPIPNLIKWRRKTKAKWNPELEHWEPLEHMQIEDEKHVLCLLSAKEFVSLATASRDEDVDTHVLRIKSACPGCIPIFLIEGLHFLLRRNKTAENRAFQDRVLNQSSANVASGSQGAKRKKPTQEPVDEDLIEDALLRLQIINECLVHHTATAFETAEWIAHFTQHISTIPYRTQRLNLSTSFCMETGQVKPGDDKDDTFTKMLQEVVRVTPPVAFGIASHYPNVVSLVKAFRKHGPLVLEDLEKSANRNGAFTDRKIGPAISRRLYKVFTETDPASMDV